MEEIIHAAKELGINYKIFTSSKTSEFYSDHQWSVIQNSQVGPVINAVPDIKIADTVPWEEWFFMDEEIHHHILFLKKHPKSKVKKRKDKFNRPHIEDVNQYMSLDEIKEYLIDDPELTNEERMDLYYEEHLREQRAKERRRLERGAKPLDEIMKELNIKPSNWKPKKK